VEAAHPRGWRLLAPVPLQTVCVRHEPVGLSGEALDRHTLAWVERINASGSAYLTAAQLDGRWMVRISIGGLQTERAQVEALWDLLQGTAEAST
jgi:aromatic-L-amino-acid decarboxylase